MICRPILLHNEFMPAKPGMRKWDYRAWGYHDGITIGKSIEISNSASMKEIFELCVNNEEEMNPYFTQFLFGFHTDKAKEEEFWKNELPFTYLCLLQFAESDVEKYRNYLESEPFIEKELKLLKHQGEQISIVVYYSMDNTDLMMIVKCEKSETGAKLINDMHRNAGGHPFKLRNSYSVLAIRSSDIDTPCKFSENNEKIDLVELRAVERKADSIGRLYKILKDNLDNKELQITVERKSLLGTEDESIIIRNIRWRELIPYYQSDTGVLNNSNECSQDYANAISTKIMFSLENMDILEDNSLSNGDNMKSFFLCDLIFKEIKDIYDNRNDEKSHAEKKNLIMLTNALRRFEYANYSGKAFSDYNFYPMFFPFYMFIKLLGKHTGNYSSWYYDFMKGMKLCTQNFAKPDRVYLQVTDFNMKYFDVPTKYVTIYSAYMYYMKKGLNTNPECNYEFLVCPGVNNRVEVREIMPRTFENGRLFFAEIPERQTYDFNLMFIILGHETAHFVGRKIRMREARKSSIIKTCSRAVSIAMKNYIIYRNGWKTEEISDPKWQKLEENLIKWLNFYVNKNCDKNYMDNNYYYDDISQENWQTNIDSGDKSCDHTDALEAVLFDSIRDMLLNKGENIFGFVIQKGLTGEVDLKSRDEYYEKQSSIIRECTASFVERRNSKNTNLTLEQVLNNLMYLMKECYADIIAILTLEISLNDYLRAFMETIEAAGETWECIENTNALPRIAIVMVVLNYSMKEKKDCEEGFRWVDEENRKIENEDIKCLEVCAKKFVKEYIKENFDAGSGIIDPRIMITNSMNIVYDSYILKEIVSYLLKCRKQYIELMHPNEGNVENIKSIERVREFYRISQVKDKFFPAMMELLNQYESDIYNDIDNIKV